jgi:hypothetical protein
MPPRLPQPYTQTLSMLRKIDLIRLSLEFRLPTDGSVVNLRDRLRVYLNAHRDTLFRNPRYNPLFPKHRRPAQPPPSPPTQSRTLSSRAPSPSNSESSIASAQSFDSWNGIGGDLQQQIPQVQPQPLLQHPADPVLHYHPPPPPSPSGSEPNSLPPSDHPVRFRKFFLVIFLSPFYSFPLPRCICT